MNEEKITTEFIQHKNGFTIAKSDLTTGKVVINNIEITSIEDWNKVTHSIVELQQENARLKDKIKKSFKIVDDKLTNLNLKYGVNNEFREEYDELWEILKEN